MTKIFTRAFRATLFQREAFRQAYFDGDSPADAAILVSLVGTLTYLGLLAINGIFGAFDIRGLLEFVIGAVISWLILAFATWGVARWLFESMSRPQTMIGVQGMAVLPLLADMSNNQLIGAAGLIWYLALLVIATQEVTDLDLRKAGVSVLIGFAVAALFRALLAVPFAAFSSLF